MTDSSPDDSAAEESDSEVVDLTTPANQAWLDEPSSWTPFRLLEDEEEIEQREQKLQEVYREVVGEEPE